MGWMPGAVRSPYPTPGRAKRRKGRGVAYHVAVSEQESLRPFPGADWHFYVSKRGTIYQFIDTDLQSWTTGAGNSSMIGVETEGGVHDADNEPWTDAQLDALARIARWAHETEGIPLRLMKSSHPTERGLGWHKLGVRPWIVPGGEVWSSAYGKICPGRRKISQMPEVLRRAQGGAAAPQEDEMSAAAEKQIAEIHRAIGAAGIGDVVTSPGDVAKRDIRTLAFLTAYSRYDSWKSVQMLAALNAQVAGLKTAITALAGGDADDIKEHIDAAVDRALAEFREVVAEGYDVRLERKADDDPAA